MRYHVAKGAVLALSLVSLGACGGARSGAEKAVLDVLKDPDSAKFGEFYYNEKTKKGCLTVNAKNSMGGYTGDQQAYVQKAEEGWVTDDISDVSSDFCRRIHADGSD
jgi:hypothetical protein